MAQHKPTFDPSSQQPAQGSKPLNAPSRAGVGDQLTEQRHAMAPGSAELPTRWRATPADMERRHVERSAVVAKPVVPPSGPSSEQGGYGYGGGGTNERREETFGTEWETPRASPLRPSPRPLPSDDASYTTNPFESPNMGTEPTDRDHRAEHAEKVSGLELARGLGSVCLLASAFFGAIGIVLAALLQFMLAIPVVLIGAALFLIGRWIVRKSAKGIEQHSVQRQVDERG